MCDRGRTMTREHSGDEAVLVSRSVWVHAMTAITAVDLALQARSNRSAVEYVLVALREMQAARAELE